ncbi:MAG: DUF1501 domain-containing protein [Phycisphaeraceae bacterium]
MSLHRNCEGTTRRDCLKLGLHTFVAGGLVGALQARADSSAPSAPKKQAKACILIWLDGGPSHYETFDPKPDAPLEIRGSFDTIATRIKGVHYSQHMKRLAAIADKTAVIRSIQHNQGNHGAGNHYMMTGAPPRIPVGCGAFVSFHPSLGSVVAKEVGAPHGIPAYFSMPSMSRSGGPNFLGAQYAPFVVGGDANSAGFRVRDVSLPSGLTGERYLSRRDLRSEIDTLQRINDERAGDPVVAMDKFFQQGHQIITSKEAQAAFDIQQEPEETRAKYGRNSFGQRALLARRLVEAGVPFITLNEGGWDHHTNLFDAFDKRMPSFDATVAALIEDLHERRMLEETMVIVLGEFGRTPKINKDGGRDHWSNAMSVLFAGGGASGGQVIGATDRQGYAAVDRILSPENFVSTIYAKLGIDPDKMLYTPQGRPAHLVSDPTPISELMS